MAKKKQYKNKKSNKSKSTKTYSGRKKFVAKRAPIVECKKLTHGVGVEKLSWTSPFNFIPNRSYIEYQRGFKNGDVIGSDIFSKYYSMKVKFRFPQDNYSIPAEYRLYLVHGWMTAPFALPSTPSSAYQLDRDTVSFNQLQQEMIQLLSHEFNTGYDDMEFRTKEKKFYKIIRKQEIKPNRNSQIGITQSAAVLVEGSTASEIIAGGPPEVMRQLNWKPMKKVRLTETAGQNAEGTGGFLYPNESWIPFAFVYSPTYDQVKRPGDDPLTPPDPNAQITVSYNDCHWFTDS